MTQALTKEAALNVINFNKDLFSQSDLLIYCYRGSHAHGTYIPSGHTMSTDDIDLAGIYFAPVDYYIGINGNKDYERGVEIKIDEYDAVFYELKRYIRMCMSCNPGALAYLWTKNEHQLVDNPAGDILIGDRTLFMTKKIYNPFVAYAKQQFDLMLKKDRQGYMGEKRKKLVEKFGYDCRNAAHVLRLLIMCDEVLTHGRLEVFRERDAQFFIEIKTGAWTLDQVTKFAEKMFAKVEDSYKKTKLPEGPDYKKINALTMTLLKPYVSRGIASFAG